VISVQLFGALQHKRPWAPNMIGGGGQGVRGIRSRHRTGPQIGRHTLMMPNWCFTDDDLIASDLVYAHVRGETSRVIAFRATPLHEWIGGD
jgi:hypothetical protein